MEATDRALSIDDFDRRAHHLPFLKSSALEPTARNTFEWQLITSEGL
jgi:hypothetical protein